MARKTKVYQIAKDNRDKGKQFILTEMSALKAEKWAMRAFLALARCQVEIPDEIAQAGMAGIATIGLKMIGGIAFDEAEPLLDEMLACVQIMPDAKNPTIIRDLFDGDIEEVSTIVDLRLEVFALHSNFSLVDVPSKLKGFAASTQSASLNTPTSQD